MIQRLPIALVQIKGDNTSESFLNEICQFLYSFYREKEVTSQYNSYKLYNNMMNLIKL